MHKLLSRWLSISAIGVVPLLAATDAFSQDIFLRCTTPERTDTVQIRVVAGIVTHCRGGRASDCVDFPARIDSRYVAFGPRTTSGGGCQNCGPMVIDRATGTITWIDGSVGECTRAQSVF